MAITRIGASAGDGTTITIPVGHQAGDLLVIFAFRSATTSPTTPAGWTAVTGLSSGASAFRLGWKLAISNADTSGTWTSATGLVCHVYRGVTTSQTPIVIGTSSTATGTTVTYGTDTLKNPGTSWVVGMAATKTTTSTIETAPTNMTNASTAVGATVEYAGHDTNGAYTLGQGTWPSTNVSVGVSAEWRSATFEILAEQGLNNNYQSVKVPDGMSTSERIR
jgi:hypothetical protein